ncbi:MAG: chemotaxis protein CheA [Pseudomonadota bacterium]
MDDDEDYQALFFAECVELLGDLQEQLDKLADGDEDPETVNAAFRAVHSVKGGAAAFGFEDLIGFAHVFETVMDKVRNGALEAEGEITALLIRAGDVLMALIEQARDGGTPDTATVERVAAELHQLANDGAVEEVPVGEASSGTANSDECDADSSSDNAEDNPSVERGVTVWFTPHPGFLRAGHEPLRLMRAAKTLGLVGVEAIGEVPLPEALDLGSSPLSWKMQFESAASLAEFRSFFEIYEAFADIDIEAEAVIEEEDGPAEAAETTVSTPGEGSAVPSTPADTPKGIATDPASQTAAASNSAPKAKIAKTLRVELPRIDRLVNLVGEVVITQAVLAQRLSEIETSNHLELDHAVESMSRQTRELQESVMAIRAQPVKSVFSRMPRVVRDLADKLGKEARLIVSGEQTEVDTTVIEELAEPLTHMLRNSMDHGLEETSADRETVGKDPVGTIRLSAEHRGERVLITVEDDGRGINRDRVLQKAVDKGLVEDPDTIAPEEVDNLIFHPGFSTAEEVSAVSGRGVGMDVVKKKIQMLGGRCTLRNTPGQGTRFVITLPLTLAVLDGMTVSVGDERFILPLSSVVEAIRIDPDTLAVLPNGSRVLRLRGDYLPLISLREALQLGGDTQPEEMAIVVDDEAQGPVAIVVDELIGQRQVVLKSLEANFRRVDGVSGATILGDGRVALILDVSSLLEMSTSAPGPGVLEAVG